MKRKYIPTSLFLTYYVLLLYGLQKYRILKLQAIHGYRESEKENWSKSSMMIFKRMKDTCFDSTHILLPYVHVLDLDSKGSVFNDCLGG